MHTESMTHPDPMQPPPLPDSDPLPPPADSSAGTRSERQWAMLTHLSGLAQFAMPGLGIVAPLVMWTMKKDDSPFLDDHGREAVNFQLSMLVYSIVCGLLCFVLIGIPMLLGLLVYEVVAVVMAAMDADKGRDVRYALTIPFL